MCPTPVPSPVVGRNNGIWPWLILSLHMFHSRFSLACGCCDMWSLEGFLSWGSGPLDFVPSPTPCESMKRIKT